MPGPRARPMPCEGALNVRLGLVREADESVKPGRKPQVQSKALLTRESGESLLSCLIVLSSAWWALRFLMNVNLGLTPQALCFSPASQVR